MKKLITKLTLPTRETTNRIHYGKEKLDMIYDHAKIEFNDYGCHETRHPSLIRLLKAAWDQFIKSDQPRPEKMIHIDTGDIFNHAADFSFSITSKDLLDKCMPNFVFDAWPEVGILDYKTTFQELVQAGETSPANSRAFWIGANTHPTRVVANDLAAQYPDLMDIRMMEWNRRDKTNLYQHTSDYITLVEHCKYRILIDLTANGHSGRLPLLLATGRPIIATDRKYEQWFWFDGSFQPWIHYIPSAETAEGMLQAVNWTVENPEKAESIGKAGQEYAKTHLRRQNAIDRMGRLLNS